MRLEAHRVPEVAVEGQRLLQHVDRGAGRLRESGDGPVVDLGLVDLRHVTRRRMPARR
ncbi:hypothetical protein ACU686_27240 [Yinghuangia aomiensis]